ncbi:solute carrier family 35, member F5 [Geosmithia morbida]|uniref:Solute carrier family 35, member F5 n=1 Tax=Geosmithia morbida TaxID=1094350 RepID=A0A9P4YS70_9HYPO|nr:solute carrier family 35, member F5 [Geosmithia morbida]KAF4120862.1 solute carrier family 35, member F5 [Geosmithia morbida]
MDSERRFPDDAVPAQTPLQSRLLSLAAHGLRVRLGLRGLGRRALGIVLLLVTVFLWTISNFLSSLIFSDQTYDKPFFLVYINTAVFAVSLVPRFIRYMSRGGVHGLRCDVRQLWCDWRQGTLGGATSSNRTCHRMDEHDTESAEALLVHGNGLLGPPASDEAAVAGEQNEDKLSFGETAKLSLEFCMLWSLANYFASACLEYTSVASVTILTSTSSVSTLVFCAILGVEPFSMRRLVGVVASLAGIVLVSTVDLTGNSDDQRGTFPEKTTLQVALGDAMALFSALIYGLYVTVMKLRVGNEDSVDMQLFFGLVGFFNLVLLWPLFFILDWTGIETVSTLSHWTREWEEVASSVSSFVSDYAWAYSMLLTTPLVVTVGLSLTIPLSLVGEMIQYNQYSSFVYWVGAAIVLVSFVFVSNESHEKKHHESSGILDTTERQRLQS